MNLLIANHIVLAHIGVGKALVGAVVKPVVGVGDAAVVILNHVGDAASEKVIVVKESKRMRRALPKIITPLGMDGGQSTGF